MLRADDWACVAGMIVGSIVIALGIIGLAVGAWVSGPVFILLGIVCWVLTIRAMLDMADLL